MFEKQKYKTEYLNKLIRMTKEELYNETRRNIKLCILTQNKKKENVMAQWKFNSCRNEWLNRHDKNGYEKACEDEHNFRFGNKAVIE